MTEHTFLPSKPEAKLEEIRNHLYERLREVRRGLRVTVAEGDEFDLGINCRMSNEAEWLEDFLDMIERS